MSKPAEDIEGSCELFGALLVLSSYLSRSVELAGRWLRLS